MIEMGQVSVLTTLHIEHKHGKLFLHYLVTFLTAFRRLHKKAFPTLVVPSSLGPARKKVWKLESAEHWTKDKYRYCVSEQTCIK